MSDIWTRLSRIVRIQGRGALVTVLDIRGSAPREAGARMIVAPDGSFSGTVGGGQLEWEAIQLAAGRLRVGSSQMCVSDFALGPDLGQCCGGRVTIATELFVDRDLGEIERLAGLEASGGFTCEARYIPDRPHAERRILGNSGEAADTAQPGVRVLTRVERFEDTRYPVVLFGAGHVGRALVLALAPLPFRVTWVDGRPDGFPKAMPRNVTPVRAARPAQLVGEAASGSLVIIMTHSHPLDLELTRAALARNDLPYVGVIGSETKRARFLSRLRDSGIGSSALARLRCPIGIDGIDDKAPPVIAASVAAELLLVSQAARGDSGDAAEGFPQEGTRREENKLLQRGRLS
ncbi:xanthine dehydrogenase accessory protein XdhC [Microbaculum marinum]|uniref:Xanthine dehydrogenase accessory protein XdhC n=1 Tax=Microbaculum marinum TaxID=1764581 RepID=A0AAW9RMT4_9HYPH